MTTVVIVDDEIEITEQFVELFELETVSVVGVGFDGKQAVELCTKYNPDFLIMDLSMPDYDGFYALEKLQNSPTKIIVITGVVEENILQKLHKFSAFFVQQKPIAFSEILKIMNI